MFGPEEDCAFPCHCVNDDICNRDDGTCTCKDEPPHDDFVGDQWEGIGCQTGSLVCCTASILQKSIKHPILTEIQIWYTGIYPLAESTFQEFKLV